MWGGGWDRKNVTYAPHFASEDLWWTGYCWLQLALWWLSERVYCSLPQEKGIEKERVKKPLHAQRNKSSSNKLKYNLITAMVTIKWKRKGVLSSRSRYVWIHVVVSVCIIYVGVNICMCVSVYAHIFMDINNSESSFLGWHRQVLGQIFYLVG